MWNSSNTPKGLNEEVFQGVVAIFWQKTAETIRSIVAMEDGKKYERRKFYTDFFEQSGIPFEINDRCFQFSLDDISWVNIPVLKSHDNIIFHNGENTEEEWITIEKGWYIIINKSGEGYVMEYVFWGKSYGWECTKRDIYYAVNWSMWMDYNIEIWNF